MRCEQLLAADTIILNKTFSNEVVKTLVKLSFIDRPCKTPTSIQNQCYFVKTFFFPFLQTQRIWTPVKT